MKANKAYMYFALHLVIQRRCFSYRIHVDTLALPVDAFSTQSIWWHWLLIAIPDNMVHLDAAWMLIDGGGNYNMQLVRAAHS